MNAGSAAARALHGFGASARRAQAFLERDALVDFTRPISFVLQIVSVACVATMFFFLARVIDPAASRAFGPALESGYFAFAFTGIAVANYLAASLEAFAARIRDDQLSGNLEMLFASPLTSSEMVAWRSLWSFLQQTLAIALYLVVGSLFGLRLGEANWIGALAVLLVSAAALSPFGIFAAAFVLVARRRAPIGVFTSLSALFAGVYYPLEALPEWLSAPARLLPLTHALEGFRMAVLDGAPLAALGRPLAVLGAFALVFTPAALWSFSAAAAFAKRNASLARF